VFEEGVEYYQDILDFSSGHEKLTILLASIEAYLLRVVDILVDKCNIRVFKPQSAFYEQFGPAGFFLLSRVRQHIKHLEEKLGIRIIVQLDCKRGDIDTTQAAYFLGFLGNLESSWGVDYSPFDFDIINVNIWMGSDVLVLGKKEGPAGLGLQLMQRGKGLIVVNKTSNPSGPQYQEQMNPVGRTLQMQSVADLAAISKDYDLENDGLSTLGLVVGSTHACDGSIRKTFPATTLLVPGFGAQGGKFALIMKELIPSGEWNGQGAIFSSSRGTMYPFLTKLGGSGLVANLEPDLIKAVEQFRVNEKAAYDSPEVSELGIRYPFV